MFHIFLGVSLAAVCGIYIYNLRQEEDAEQNRWKPPPVQDHIDNLPGPDSNV